MATNSAAEKIVRDESIVPQGLKPRNIFEPSDGTAEGVPFQNRAVWKFSCWSKTAQILVLAVAVCLTLGATDAGARFNDLGHRLMCTCGCAQLLGECNHVGCTESGREREELKALIAKGLSDKEILASFSAKYGATVLAAPPTEGFNLVAWIAPFAVFAAALLGTILLIRRWAVGKTDLAAQAAVAAASATPAGDALRDQIRRETGSDGGF